MRPQSSAAASRNNKHTITKRASVIVQNLTKLGGISASGSGRSKRRSSSSTVSTRSFNSSFNRKVRFHFIAKHADGLRNLVNHNGATARALIVQTLSLLTIPAERHAPRLSDSQIDIINRLIAVIGRRYTRRNIASGRRARLECANRLINRRAFRGSVSRCSRNKADKLARHNVKRGINIGNKISNSIGHFEYNAPFGLARYDGSAFFEETCISARVSFISGLGYSFSASVGLTTGSTTAPIRGSYNVVLAFVPLGPRLDKLS